MRAAPQVQKDGPRTNEDIRVRDVQLIDHTGVNRGTVPTHEAIALARDNGRPAVREEPLHFFTSGGLGTVLAMAAVSLVLFQPLLGAGALSGGQLLPLGSFDSLWRNVGWGRSKVTAIRSGWWSRTRLSSIDVKPNTALVTWPDAVVRSVGNAWNAR